MASNVNWKEVWESVLKAQMKFPITIVDDDKDTISVSCPTRFSDTGAFSIQITPTFNQYSINLEILTFNENVSLKDLKIDKKLLKYNNADYNSLSKPLIDYELSNRILNRFEIQSKGFKDNKEAVKALTDYINDKATESGRMFDDKLNALNDEIYNKKNEALLKTIRNSRRTILKKVESILKSNYGWKATKNEDFNDSTISLKDKNGNLAAVVTLVGDCVIVDLAKDITAKVSVMQSDEEIEQELVSDVNNAQTILADREVEQLKDIVANNRNRENIEAVADEDYFETLSNRITKLESLYIKRRLRKFR